jgi:DNA-binding CsgD family transcriptional regulator
MSSDDPFHLEDDGVLELLRDYEALRMWEVLRSARSVVTVATAADKTGLPALAPREREVALALAEGLSRAHVAERMRLSVHTVSTLARRVYRKLGVSSQAALAARLAGHARRKLGER